MLLQVYLTAIEGHVPTEMVQAFSAYLDFCYIVRQSSLTEDDLDAVDEALQHFHNYRSIFEETGVRSETNRGGPFSLP